MHPYSLNRLARSLWGALKHLNLLALVRSYWAACCWRRRTLRALRNRRDC